MSEVRMRIDRAKKNEELLETSKTTVESYLWTQKNMELLIQVARITRLTLFCFNRGEKLASLLIVFIFGGKLWKSQK